VENHSFSAGFTFIDTYFIHLTILNLLVDGIFYLDEYFCKKNDPDQRVFLFNVLSKIGYLISINSINENKLVKKEANKVSQKIFDKILIIFGHDLERFSNKLFTKEDIKFLNERCSVFPVGFCI
jgi:hypothetical protein